MTESSRTSDDQTATVPTAPASDGTETAEWTPFPSRARARAAASAGQAQTPLPASPTGPTASTAQLGAPATAPPAARPPATSLRYYWYDYPFIRAAAIIAALAIVGLLVWLLLLRGDSAPKVEPGGAPVILTPAQLATFSGEIGQPIYWVGPTAGVPLEVTATPTNSKIVFVRYLTGAASAGDPSTQFLTVGTYPEADAYAKLRAWARQHDAPVSRVPDGGIAVSVPRSPTSVFYASPTRDVQVQVYDPHRGEALRLVTSGAAQPVFPSSPR
jgi:hypothetical protein